MLLLSHNLLIKAEDETRGTMLERLRELEKRLFKETEALLREKALLQGVDPNRAVKAHMTIIDHDLWVIDNVLKMGVDNFIKRLSKIFFSLT